MHTIFFASHYVKHESEEGQNFDQFFACLLAKTIAKAVYLATLYLHYLCLECESVHTNSIVINV